MQGIGFNLQFQSAPAGMNMMAMPGMGGGFPLAMYSNASMLMGPPVGAMMAGMGSSGMGTMMMGNMMMGNMMPMLAQQMMMQQMQMLMFLQMMMMMQQMQRGNPYGMPNTGLNPGYMPPPNIFGGNSSPYGLGPGAFPGNNFPANLGNGTATANGVPWFSQFDGRHVPDAGSMACFRACCAMARAAGVNVLGPGSRIQVATGEDGRGRVSVNPKAAEQGRNYIDNELGDGNPVVVGVSYAAGRDYNVDHMTDHFVIITGRGQDKDGKTYYTFNDPGSTNGSRGSDKNPNNRFYVDAKTGELYRPAGNGVKQFDVAMVRRNA